MPLKQITKHYYRGNRALHHRYGIMEMTLQIEADDCTQHEHLHHLDDES